MDIPGFNIAELLGQAKKMGERFTKLQTSLESKTIEGDAGGGMVIVKMTGTLKVTDLVIDPALLSSGDTALLKDLVKSAMNDACSKAKQLLKEELSVVTGGLPFSIPGL